MASPYQNTQLAPAYDPEQGDFDPSRVGRKKSLVRPDREKIEPGHRQWHYRSHVAQAEDDGMGRVGVMPSSAFYFSFYFVGFVYISFYSDG
jgi:chitin synthase